MSGGDKGGTLHFLLVGRVMQVMGVQLANYGCFGLLAFHAFGLKKIDSSSRLPK